jgi:hypothetical protein
VEKKKEKTVQQEGHHPSPQNPEYQVPIPGLDTKGKTPELYQAD